MQMCGRAGNVLAVLVLFGIACSVVESGYVEPGPRYRCPKEKVLLYPCTCDLQTDLGIFVSCNNSNLASMSVALNNLASFRIPIEQLLINKCHFARLFGSLLYRLHLRKLLIVDTPVESIDEFAFLGVNETLNEFHLLNSSLQTFPRAAFQILGNLSVLSIDGHQMSAIPKNAFGAMAAKLHKLQVSNGSIGGIAADTFQALRRLKSLDLHANHIHALARSQFKGLRELEVLDLSFNSIPKVDASHMSDLLKLGFLNVSHNLLKEITRGAFARNSVLKVLNMAHNQIKKLDSNSFKGMRFLRRLYLSDNHIEDVGRSTFASLSKIGTIDLARNRIRKIDYQMFYQLKFIEIINLSHNNVSIIEKLAFKDIYLSHIDLSHNNISKIESGAFENCANISLLDLSYNQLRNISTKAWDETTYATELQLSYNHLSALNQVPLSNMTGLKVLNVSHNEITKISKKTFPKLYELHTIDLSHNNLTDIFSAVFQLLFSLRNLNMSYNHLKNFKPGTFGTIPTLLDLDLSYNLIQSMPKSTFTRLSAMRRLTVKGNKLKKLFTLPISVSHLDLSHNQFEELPESSEWPTMNSLLSLDLSDNKLGDTLGVNSFDYLLTLQSIDLSSNGIARPPWEALSKLVSLQRINLQNNNISVLSRAAFGKLPVVFELNLANNMVHNISSRAFEGLLQLLVLNLTNNNISHIPNGAFQGLVALQTLDLSSNRIDKLDNKTHGIFDDCLSLVNLNLSHNRLTFISRKTFPSSPYYPYKLKEIDMSYNRIPIITYDFVFGMGRVTHLNLSHNAISAIRQYVVGNWSSMAVLDLSHNELEDFLAPEESKRRPPILPPTLTQLYLAHNRIAELPWEQFTNASANGCSQLNMIDIRHNAFTAFHPTLIHLLRNQTDVYFEGNPLDCDCHVRPLKRHLSAQFVLKSAYKSIKCSSPLFLANKSVVSVPENRFNCPLAAQNDDTRSSSSSHITAGIDNDNDTEDSHLTPDLSFRGDISMGDDSSLRVRWRVMKTDDIADTQVTILRRRHGQRSSTVLEPDILYEITLPYFQRSFNIPIGNLSRWSKAMPANNRTEYEICLLAQDSQARIRAFYQQQCKHLPIINGAPSLFLSLPLLICLVGIRQSLLY